MSFEVEIRALRSDATLWDGAAEDLSQLAGAMKSFTLSGEDDLTLLGKQQGLDVSYENARSTMEKRIGEAARYFVDIADALIAVATTYEQMDAERAGVFDSQGGN
jgi:hypothetical protein